jgi:ABC-type antimicrobial peptide transport system permease subunit
VWAAKERSMRLIFGMILGAALTVGAAYVSDTAQKSATDRMVNWEVVSKNTDSVVTMIKQGWAKLTG